MSKLWAAPQNAQVKIYAPGTDEWIGMTVELRPQTAPEVKRVERRHLDAMVADAQRRGKITTAVKQEERAIDLLTAAIVGWTWDDKVPPDRRIEYSEDAARDLLADEKFREQLDRAWGVDANFWRD